jgi:hypothetical protein
MPYHSARRHIGGLLASAILAACGGGDTVTPPCDCPATYNFQIGMLGLVKIGSTANVNLSGTAIVQGVSTPFTGTGALTLSPAVSGTFNGMAAMLQTQSITGTVMAASQSAPYSVSTVNAYDAQGDILGESQSGEFDVAPAPIFIPTYVSTTLDQLGSLTRYSDSQLSSVKGMTQLSVVVQLIPVDPGSPEVVQLTAKVYDVNQALVETDNISYQLTAGGSLSFNSETTQSNSGTLTVTLQ